MANQARVEEVSDSDSDPPEVDISNISPAATSSLFSPSNMAAEPMLQPQLRAPGYNEAAERERSKHWQCLYPIYFDANRSRTEGRRVGKQQAVDNPLAREIVDAAASLGLQVVFEPGKTHPKDWANPGRVRVLLKDGDTRVARNINNKHHLYQLISTYLRTHPTTEESPFRLRIAGLPVPEKPIPPPSVPKGWKINSILPLHSPAISGGGVMENLQGLLPGMPGIGGESAESSGDGRRGKSKKKMKG
jgi:signal recognition particle subunit SRP19